MRWAKGRRSTNIEDRRRGGPRIGRGVGGLGAIIAVIAVFLLGGDPRTVLDLVGGGGQLGGQQQIETSPEEEQVKDFLAVVLADTEDTWGPIFQNAGSTYQPPSLVLYRNATPTACGQGQAAAGPFYCPADQKLYLDLSFLGEMKRMGAEGDFALAYVIAHEVGHHIQTLVGSARDVRQMQAGASQIESNQLQVSMELQADCYAGIWAHHAQRQRQILEPGDIEEGIRAAAAVGDDHLQRLAGRRIVPEAFTHGSSQQRMTWLKRGLDTGSLQACDTFNG